MSAKGEPRRYELRTGVDFNAMALIGGGVALLSLFTLVRGLGNPEGSFGRTANVVTAIALLALLPFIYAVFAAARNGFLELGRDGMLLRVGFLVNARVPYEAIEAVSGPERRPKSSYGVSASYGRHELSLGQLSEAVEVSLVERRRVATRLLFPFLRVERLWIGVDDPKGLIRELRERTRNP